MDSNLKFGISIKELKPLNHKSGLINLGTFKVQEDQATSKSGTPTADGGNFSNMKEKTSSMSGTKRSSMSLEEEILKVKVLLYGADITKLTRDGRSFILIKLNKLQLKEKIQISVSTLIDHSLSFQECQ